MLGRIAVLEVSFEERLIAKTAAQYLWQVVLEEQRQGFWCDAVGTPVPVQRDRCLQPALINPSSNLLLSDAEGSCQAFKGESIAPNFFDSKLIAEEHVADCLGSAVDFLSDFFNGQFD